MPLGDNMNDPFKTMESEDPEGVRQAKESVEQAYADAAGVSVEDLRIARGLIRIEGYYGISDGELNGMSFGQAKEICQKALRNVVLPSVEYLDPTNGFYCAGFVECAHPDHKDVEDAGPIFHAEPVEIDSSALRDWYWHDIKPVYGHYNI
jgi:hypothetical protein